MVERKKLNPSEKEQLLTTKIGKIQNQLEQLQAKRKREIADIAYQHGLQNLDNQALNQAFKEIAGRFMHENSD